MKKRKGLYRIINILLTVTLLAGNPFSPLTVRAQEETPRAEASEDTLSPEDWGDAESFRETGLPELVLPAGVNEFDLHKNLSGALGGSLQNAMKVKVGVEAVDKLWEAIFGSGTNNRDLLNALGRMNVVVGEINMRLQLLIQKIAKEELRRNIQEKLTVLRQAQTHTENYMKVYNAVSTKAGKERQLDAWYNNNISNQNNMINFLDLYSRMVTNCDGNNLCGDFFTMYETLAKLQYGNKKDQMKFIAEQQGRDFYLVALIGGMSAQYLAMERERAGNDDDKKRLVDAKAKIAEAAVNRIKELAEKHKVDYNAQSEAADSPDIETYTMNGSVAAYGVADLCGYGLTLVTDQNENVFFYVPEAAGVYVDLQAGDYVSVTYYSLNEQKIAIRIERLEKPAPAPFFMAGIVMEEDSDHVVLMCEDGREYRLLYTEDTQTDGDVTEGGYCRIICHTEGERHILDSIKMILPQVPVIPPQASGLPYTETVTGLPDE